MSKYTKAAQAILSQVNEPRDTAIFAVEDALNNLGYPDGITSEIGEAVTTLAFPGITIQQLATAIECACIKQDAIIAYQRSIGQ